MTTFGHKTHELGRLTLLCDAAITLEFALVKFGSDVDHVAVTADTTDKPLGIAYSKTDEAEQEVTVQLLGKGADTKGAVASGAITYDDRLIAAAADGYVATLPGDAGTYWVIGRALETVADGAAIEFDDCQPYPVVVG